MKALRKENKKYIWAACLCFMIIGLVIFMGIWQPLHDPEISRLENSTVDLQGIYFDTGKPIILKGEWEFFLAKIVGYRSFKRSGTGCIGPGAILLDTAGTGWTGLAK